MSIESLKSTSGYSVLPRMWTKRCFDSTVHDAGLKHIVQCSTYMYITRADKPGLMEGVDQLLSEV